MATAVDVMKYIKSQMSLMGDVQLQKLVYYAQAWSLAWDGKPLFHERVEAWRMGPVVPAIRYRTDEPDMSALAPGERATVDAVIDFYGRHHGQALADKSHSETPWQAAWAKRPEGSSRGNEEITHEAMRRFYTSLALEGVEVPKRAAVIQDASELETREIAAANAHRWRDTLAILAK